MSLVKKFHLISYIIAAIRYLKGKLINIKIRNSKKSIFSNDFCNNDSLLSIVLHFMFLKKLEILR